jgi:hypothetical protein
MKREGIIIFLFIICTSIAYGQNINDPFISQRIWKVTPCMNDSNTLELDTMVLTQTINLSCRPPHSNELTFSSNNNFNFSFDHKIVYMENDTIVTASINYGNWKFNEYKNELIITLKNSVKNYSYHILKKDQDLILIKK